MTFKLISYNIWHGTYLNKVLAFLDQERPDIICLQEVGTTGQALAASDINLYESIRKHTGYYSEYGDMFSNNYGNGIHTMGVATYSKFPIVNRQEFSYERKRTTSVLKGVDDRYNLPRVLLDLDLDIEGRLQKVVSTHMTITEDATVSEHQLKSIRAVKDYLSAFDDYLLCGDMNIPYGNESYRLLSDGLQDWSLPEQPSLHPTIHKVGEKGYHVDYVFYKGDSLAHVSSKVPIVDASDHLPVVVEFER